MRPKSHESDASILDQAKLSTANRHRPKGDHRHLRVVFIASISIIIIVFIILVVVIIIIVFTR